MADPGANISCFRALETLCNHTCATFTYCKGEYDEYSGDTAFVCSTETRGETGSQAAVADALQAL